MAEEEKNEILIEESKEEKKQVVTETKKEEKKSSAKKEEKKEIKKVPPKLFFKEDEKILISVDGYHSNQTGELQYVIATEDNKSPDDSLLDVFTKVTYKFWFSRVTYDKLNTYRSRSIIYNSEDQNNTVNTIRLREFFLIYHLIDWNLTDENGEKIVLKFDPNKALSDESLKLVNSLPSLLIDNVLQYFERKVIL